MQSGLTNWISTNWIGNKNLGGGDDDDDDMDSKKGEAETFENLEDNITVKMTNMN